MWVPSGDDFWWTWGGWDVSPRDGQIYDSAWPGFGPTWNAGWVANGNPNIFGRQTMGVKPDPSSCLYIISFTNEATFTQIDPSTCKRYVAAQSSVRISVKTATPLFTPTDIPVLANEQVFGLTRPAERFWGTLQQYGRQA